MGEMRNSTGAVAILPMLLASLALAGQVSFTAKPTAVKDGEKVKITFAVSGPTDVEVAVLGADGKVARHMAAGVLGAKNPPPDPLKAGLAQELVWDGNDDFRQPAAKGPFQVRVRAGMQLKLGALLADDPLYVCYPLSLSTDDDGNLYFLSNSVAGGPDWPAIHHLRVFNRKGVYLRTLMPMPASLPLEKAKGFEVVELDGQRWAPRSRCGTWPEFYRNEQYATGNCFQMGNRVGKDRIITLCNNGSLLRLNLDGSPAGPGPQPVPLVPGRTVNRWAPIAAYFYITLSPDGSRVYLSGLGSSGSQKSDPVFPAGRILAFDGKEAKTFAYVERGDKQKAPNRIPRVNYADLAGMSCDGQGNVFVCDPTDGKVRVFDPGGKAIGDVAVENALRVACHRRTGDIYVLSVTPAYGRGEKMLRKFSPLKDGAKELARFPLPESGEDACMALDDTAERPVVWAATRAGHGFVSFNAPARVLRLEDTGNAFVETPHPIAFEVDGVKDRLAVHPETEVVVFKGQNDDAGAAHGLTGEKVVLPFKKCIDMTVGQDGNWYLQTVQGFCGYVCKYDKDLKPIATNPQLPAQRPGAKIPTNAVGYAFGKAGAGISAAGLAADQAGRLFALQLGNVHVDGGYFVTVFGPDGKVEEHPWAKDHPSFEVQQKEQGFKFFNSALVALAQKEDWHSGHQGGGLQVDAQGNLYVGTMLLPLDYQAPPGYEKDPGYLAVGSVFKFPKEGGQFVNVKGVLPADRKGLLAERRFWPKGKVFVENATAVYPGLGSMAGSVGHGCSCRKPMFHVDGYGRLAIPNAITFKVRLMDNAGNEILEVGKYGNIDAIEPLLKGVQESLPKNDPLHELDVSPVKSDNVNALLKAKPLPASEVFFGWPQAVTVSERAVYVADVYNHCIVRLDKTCATEATCEIK